MHPFFGRPSRLAAYLVVWLVVGALLAAVLTRLGLGWLEALGLLLPVFFVYSFVCLSAWYVCRAAPLGHAGVGRVAASWILAAVVAGSIWLGLIRLWIDILSATAPSLTSAGPRYQQLVPFLFAVGVLAYFLAIAVHYAVIALEAAGEVERQRLQADVLTREAELRALRAQVDPHFLYNSLNSISALTTADPAGARRMCLLLGDLLRATLGVSAQEYIRLEDELALAERFLDIEKVRFGDRLKVERHVDKSTLECRVPSLILQPLVENAVTHGIAGMVDGGAIQMDFSRANDNLTIAIGNPCDPDTPPEEKLGVGLGNVRKRLEVMFGTSARLTTHAVPGRYRVELQLPWSTDDR
jgi:sensor histidine kinase YesM